MLPNSNALPYSSYSSSQYRSPPYHAFRDTRTPSAASDSARHQTNARARWSTTTTKTLAKTDLKTRISSLLIQSSSQPSGSQTHDRPYIEVKNSSDPNAAGSANPIGIPAEMNRPSAHTVRPSDPK